MNEHYGVTILGSGTSTGIPMLGCNCAVCTSPNPFNTRLRTSFLLTTKSNKKILIDTTPDFRTQALRAKISHIDFCILTHEHADHVHGIDDLRPFCFSSEDKSINIYTHEECAKNLTTRFDYIFDDQYFNQAKPILGGGIPRLQLNTISNFLTPVTIQDEVFHFFLLPHGHGKTMGFTYEKLAIVIDCHEVPEEVLAFLKAQNLEVLIIDCVKEGHHSTHLSLDKSFSYSKTIGAKHTYFIHMSHHLEHEYLQKKCEEISEVSCSPAYDTMHITL